MELLLNGLAITGAEDYKVLFVYFKYFCNLFLFLKNSIQVNYNFKILIDNNNYNNYIVLTLTWKWCLASMSSHPANIFIQYGGGLSLVNMSSCQGH